MRGRAFTHFGVIAALLAVVALVGAFPVQVPGTAAAPQFAAERLTLPGLAAAAPTTAATELAARAVPLTVVSAPTQSDTVLGASNATGDALASLQAKQQGSTSPVDSVGSSEDERVPIYFEYEVKAGDTLSGIARKFGIGKDYIVWNNVDVIDDEDSLAIGTRLQVPSVEGIIHSVRQGETLSEITKRFDANVEDTVSFRANDLADDPNNVPDGAVILVVGGRNVPIAPTIQPRPGSNGNITGAWGWPVDSRSITSLWGPGHPLGIDIGQTVGSPIYAAAAGTVAFTGGIPCCSYGYHVIIDNGDGYETLYAHLSNFNVTIGQAVAVGDVIGYVGLTGNTTGPHLHFEIRRNHVYQDPLQYLP